jgi:hypothetical protein
MLDAVAVISGWKWRDSQVTWVSYKGTTTTATATAMATT